MFRIIVLAILSCFFTGCAIESKFTISYQDKNGVNYGVALTGQNK